MRWYHWYILIVSAGTVLAASDNPNPVADLFYLLPFNLIFWFVPVWAIRWYWTKGYKKYFAIVPDEPNAAAPPPAQEKPTTPLQE
jgi:hypothetical protein